MLQLEPPRTRYDLRFGLGGFAVRIHPAFWLITGLLGLQAEQFDFVELLMWVGVVFISILVHELGHAVAIRRYGRMSRIILYHFGGLATIEPREALFGNDEELTPRAKIIIAAAGPLAGFALAGVLIGMLCLLPINFRVETNPTFGLWFQHDLDRSQYGPAVSKLDERVQVLQREEPGSDKYNDALRALSRATGATFSASEDPRPMVEQARRAVSEYARHRRLGGLINDLLFVNIFWGLMNLLPVFPLDGGQIARELYCLRHRDKGLERAFMLSVVVACVVAVLGLAHFGFNGTGLFFALMFGMLAFINYRLVQQLRQMGGGYGGPRESGDYEPEDWWKR